MTQGIFPPDSADSPGSTPAQTRRRKLSAIMMADVSGFSRMMGADEEYTVDCIQDFHQRVRSLVERFEGRVVDTAGDSVFGEFDSVVNAVNCACQIQQEQSQRNHERPPEQRIDTRIGVHLGDVIVEGDNVYGDGVNIAARLEPLADPGGICISEAVYQQVRNRLTIPVTEVGLTELKNIQHPVRLFKIPPLSETTPHTTPQPVEAPKPAPRSPVAEVSTPPALPAMSWAEQLRKPSHLVNITIASFLLLSPLVLFPTGGVFPTGGAIYLSVVLGQMWARQAQRHGNRLIALGIAIASGAVWTNWSNVTNSLFILAGLIVMAIGVGRSPAHSRQERRKRRHAKSSQ